MQFAITGFLLVAFAHKWLVESTVPTLGYGLILVAMLQAQGSITEGRGAVNGILATGFALLVTPLINIMLVFFGAQPMGVQGRTMLAAGHISMLTVQPMVAMYGLRSPQWLKIVSFQQAMTRQYAAAIGAIIGAWIGAMPIVLDWDRPWQVWPITVVEGAYLGHSTGSLAMWVLAKRRPAAA